MSSSSFPSLSSQLSLNVPVLSEFLRGEKEQCRVWLRIETNQIHDQLMDSLFPEQNGPSSSSSALPQHRASVPELCQLLEGKKAEVRMVMSGKMDQLVNDLFDGLTNKLRAYSDLDRSVDGTGDSVRVDSQLDRVESPISAQPLPILPFKARLFTEHEIKTELEYGNVDEFFAELGLPTGSQQQQTRPAADTVQLAANEGGDDESGRMENAPMDTTPPAHLTRQSQANIRKCARHAKRQVPQARNKVTNRDNLHVEGDEETVQNDEVSTRHAKKPRMDTTPREEGDRMESGQEPIGEQIATASTTNPAQPHLAEPNHHFQCAHCHKSFDDNSHLLRHVRVHTGERPFQCLECDKRFARKDSLDSHLFIHSGERPFACRHCDKSFTQIFHRTKHEQAIHLHAKPFRCTQCGHTATESAALIRHIRVIHFGLPATTKEQHELNIIDHRDPRELIEKV